MGKRVRRGFWRTLGVVLLRAGLIAVAIALIAIAGLRWIDPPTSSILLQENLSGKTPPAHWVSFEWRPLQHISAQMAVAVIAAEDQRFLQHHGLDFVELSKVLREGGGRPRGASTITQQVAKNLFLWRARNYPRKVLEAGLAVFIDFVWGKRRVLEIYLNIAQFGPNLYGVENASRHFFGKPAAHLNRHEAARLAAVLPNPNSRSARYASENVMRRQRWILEQMEILGGAGLIEGLE